MFKVIPFLLECIGWLQIVASPLLTGLVIGAVVYFYSPDSTGLVIGITATVFGLLVGIIWATKIWKKKGTITFLSRLIATPELDEKNKDGNTVA